MQATAGIELVGSGLRYAEVKQTHAGYRLLRLGNCSFDFDVVGELLHSDTPRHLSVIAEALRDVLRGAESRRLRIAIHPHDAYAFTTPLPTEEGDSARQRQLEDATALVVGQPAATQLQVEARAARPASASGAGESAAWTQALALPQVVRGRISRVTRQLPHRTHEWRLSTEGAAQVARWVEQQADPSGAPPSEKPFSLAVGWYGAHAEYVVLREGEWFYGHYAATDSIADSAYFAAMLLSRLNVSVADVGRLYLYGRDLDLDAFAPLQAVFGTTPQRLDPLAVVGVSPDKLENHFEPAEYAPCIGAVL